MDDYLLKPAPISELVDAIERKLKSAERRPVRPNASKRISEIIRENIAKIVQLTLAAMKTEPELADLPLTDEQRVFPFASLLEELAGMLAASDPDNTIKKNMHSSAMRGHIRRLQGYSIPLIIASLRLLENAVYEVIGENLLALDISFIISDIRQLNNNLALNLQETVRAYLAGEERRLIFDNSEKWAGWYCASCCWNRPEPKSESERSALAARIDAEFDAHNCETFARENWKNRLADPAPPAARRSLNRPCGCDISRLGIRLAITKTVGPCPYSRYPGDCRLAIDKPLCIRAEWFVSA